MIFLSVLVPVRNEAEHIGKVLDQLLTQDYEPGRWEIIVIDGGSTDQTPLVIQKYTETYPDLVRYAENPRRLASAARNIGVKLSRGEAVIIVDGHCIIDNNNMLRNVNEAFAQSVADCLGRPQPLEMSRATALQWAIASARRSPLGHHPDSFIYSGKAQFAPASSVAVAYRKSVFDKIGYFDESFDACEDVEFNTRCDKAGLRCYFEPAIAVHYVPRKTLGALFYQMQRYGSGRVRLGRKHRHTFSMKSFAPGFFVTGVLLGLLYVLIQLLFLPKESVSAAISLVYVFICGIYAVVVLVESARIAVRRHPADILYLPIVFPAIHFGYGWGILRELFCGFNKTRNKQLQ